jgi:NADH:ubiquinone oxidoreductase subunit 5 (subunit L)/multisubunit Na+/H+ antiporter MnhA subunit
LALLLVLALFTLMGLPPTPGFWGKLSLFGSALAAARATAIPAHDAWLIALVVIAVLNSALAAAYYLRVIAAVLLYENEQPAHAVSGEAQHIGALLCGFLLLIFALYPSGLLSAGLNATRELTHAVAASPATSADAWDATLAAPLMDASTALAERQKKYADIGSSRSGLPQSIRPASSR